MFGNKREKQERLDQYAAMLGEQALSQAEMAKRLGVPRSTVMRDLTDLDDQGIQLEEDAQGHVRLSRKWWQ